MLCSSSIGRFYPRLHEAVVRRSRRLVAIREGRDRGPGSESGRCAQHTRFVGEYRFPFRLVVDEGSKIAAAYGAAGALHTSGRCTPFAGTARWRWPNAASSITTQSSPRSDDQQAAAGLSESDLLPSRGRGQRTLLLRGSCAGRAEDHIQPSIRLSCRQGHHQRAVFNGSGMTSPRLPGFGPSAITAPAAAGLWLEFAPCRAVSTCPKYARLSTAIRFNRSPRNQRHRLVGEDVVLPLMVI